MDQKKHGKVNVPKVGDLIWSSCKTDLPVAQNEPHVTDWGSLILTTQIPEAVFKGMGRRRGSYLYSILNVS